MKHVICIIFVLLSTGIVFACSCVDVEPSEKITTFLRAKDDQDSRTVIFAGEVIKIEKSPYLLQVTFDAETSWKGTVNRTMIINTSDQESACGYPFKMGEKYLVYASSRKGQMLQTHTCTATTLLAGAGLDLSILGKGKPVTGAPPILPQKQPTQALWTKALLGFFAMSAVLLWSIRRRMNKAVD